MATTFKKCAQCGQMLPESYFKIKYTRTNGTKLRTQFCKYCCADTARYNALCNAPTLSEADAAERNVYVNGFRELEKLGLSTPLSRNASKESATPAEPLTPRAHIEKLAMYYNMPAPQEHIQPKEPDIVEQADGPVLPDELGSWLDGTYEQWCQQNATPEYLNDMVYPTLKQKYRPEIGWNDALLVPIYDETYKEALTQISSKFWDYSDWYYARKKG